MKRTSAARDEPPKFAKNSFLNSLIAASAEEIVKNVFETQLSLKGIQYCPTSRTFSHIFAPDNVLVGHGELMAMLISCGWDPEASNTSVDDGVVEKCYVYLLSNDKFKAWRVAFNASSFTVDEISSGNKENASRKYIQDPIETPLPSAVGRTRGELEEAAHGGTKETAGGGEGGGGVEAVLVPPSKVVAAAGSDDKNQKALVERIPPSDRSSSSGNSNVLSTQSDDQNQDKDVKGGPPLTSHSDTHTHTHTHSHTHTRRQSRRW